MQYRKYTVLLLIIALFFNGILGLTSSNPVTPIQETMDDTWRRVADMPTPRGGPAVAVVNNKVYAIGGTNWNMSWAISTMEEYDPITNTWQSRADMPTRRRYLAAVEVGGKIYAIGGYNDNYNPGEEILATVEEYDPVTDTWTTKTPMSIARSGLAAVEVGGKIYAIGGSETIWTCSGNVCRGDSKSLSTVEEYDPTTNIWRTRAPMPTSRAYLGLTVIKGKIYAIGGLNFITHPSNVVSIVEEYDPATDTWRMLTAMPTARWSLAVAAVGGRIYCIGGHDNQGNSLSIVEEYDSSTQYWHRRARIQTPRYSITAAVVNGKIYVFGGIDGTNLLSIVEEYDPPFYDTDGDGLADDVELGRYRTNPLISDADVDTDGDGLTNVAEVDSYSTNPTTVDTDEDGLLDGTEITYGTNPLVMDTDRDGLVDGDEVNRYKTNPLIPDANVDTDDDGLINVEEVDTHGSSPSIMDTDEDGLLDGDEVNMYGTSPVMPDTDVDDLSDYEELNTYGSNPLRNDTDGDELSDGAEVNTYGTSPIAGDTDGDGLVDGAEVNIHGTNPITIDTDGDQLTDKDEVATYGTRPTSEDTDEDGLLDGAEVEEHKTDPLNADTDGDSLSDGEEVITHRTNPTVADTDGDGVSDGAEIEAGTDPLDPKSGGEGVFISGFSFTMGLLTVLFLVEWRKWRRH